MIFDHALADAIARGLVLSALGLGWILLLVRIVGLRSFSKMTNFDFVMTVAMGSLLAGAAQTGRWVDLVQTLTAMAALFAIQFSVAHIRQRSDRLDAALQNAPVLLMRDGEILHAALRRTRVTESDLMAKLREANALQMSSVRAVVLETTGDVSVLHGDNVDQTLLRGVERDRR
ncbi:DUF421 domain-containing protein [Roseobacter sp. YSTF-M11]|uniref:DUF421 domain-containing protein n=1 Tax=Roseobacter insulae TaxID=2859783 RepID=A0A9X1FXI1_9RHOB|nr:YetF domain-containing protein [Roseobacter insulae]MBW4709521.1 DUF421 domain-containing protein [Roseobacter insulae]